MRDHVRWRLGVAATVMVVAALAVLLTGSVALAADPTEPYDNGECRQCHDSTTTYDGGVTQKWDYFDVNSAVPTESDPCAACHLSSFDGPTHPFHNIGTNCGGCHVGMLFPLFSAIPWSPDGASTFNNSSSRVTSSSVIHQIHNTPSWPSGFSVGTGANSVCADCHAAAACAACHTGANPSTELSTSHTRHGGLSGTTETVTWTYGPATGSIEETNTCSGTSCHNLPSLDTWRGALLYEDGKTVSNLWSSNPPEGYAVNSGIAYCDNLGSSISAGARYYWGKRVGGNYSYGVEAYCNKADYYVTIPFTGARAVLIADLDSYRGIARVQIFDGATPVSAPVDVDLYSADTKPRQAVFDSLGTLLNPAVTYTMRITVTGTKRAAAKATWITFDQLQVFGEGDTSYANRNAAKCTGSGCHSAERYESVHTSGTVVSFSHEATQEVTPISYGGNNYNCSQCHYLTFKVGIDPNTEHGRTSSNVVKDCSPCHGDAAWPGPSNGSVDPLWNGTCSANTCHNSGANEHAAYDSQHDTSGLTGEDTTCLGCHVGDLREIHDNSVDNLLTPNCLTCHGTTKYYTKKSCTSGTPCHGTMSSFHPQVDASHVATSSQPAAPNVGSLACTTCHNLYVWHSTQVGEHEKSWSRTTSNGVIGCLTCHSAVYYPSGWATANAYCTDCHATGKAPAPHGDYTVKHNYETYDGANYTGCEVGGYCHDVSLGDLVHTGDWPRSNSGACVDCHDATTQSTEQLCADCHVGAPYHAQSTAHDATGAGNDGCANGSCHTAYETLTGHAGGCVSCHNNATLTASNTRVLQGTYTDACTSCHYTGAGGIGAPQPTPDHYPVASHTTTSTVMSTSVDNVGTKTKNCLSCHVADLEAEHAVVLGEAYNNYGNSVDCIDCHGSSSPINAAPQVTANWSNDDCADCHVSKAWDEHDSVIDTATASGTRHNQSVDDTTTSNAACSSSGCHEGAAANMAFFHNERTAVTTPTPGVTSCNLCHEDAETAPVATTCLGCHPDRKADHGAATAHTFDANGDYASTGTYGVGDPAGCTNSGAGCHGSESTYADFVPYHTNLTEAPGCQLTCHSSGSKASFTSTYDGDADCRDCHNSNYTNAPDRIELYNAPNDGHYSDATHTAVSMDTSETGYTSTANALCNDCHSAGLKTAHTATTTSGDVVCGECHTAESIIVAASSWDYSCTQCHDGTPTALKHATRDANHTESEVGCTGTGDGCHGTDTDLASIHAGAASGCAATGCHTTLNTRPAAVSGCTNGGSGCHAGYNDTTHYSAGLHTTTTQGTAQYSLNGQTPTCASCHYTSAGTDMELDPEHTLSTSTMTGAGATSCLKCHNDSATSASVVDGNWSTKLCNACHNAADTASGAPTMHLNVSGHSSGTTSASCSSSGAGCHNTADISSTFNSGAGLHTDCATCHTKGGAASWQSASDSNLTYSPTLKTCGNTRNCHNTGYDTTTLVHSLARYGAARDGNDAGKHAATSQGGTFQTLACSICHVGLTTNLTVEHTRASSTMTGAGTTSCAKCHNDSGSTAVVKASWSGRLCTDCHNDADTASGAPTPHLAYDSLHTSTSTGTCASTGTGCHNSADLRTIHPGAAGCQMCHGPAKYPAGNTCGGVGSACHVNFTTTHLATTRSLDSTHTATAGMSNAVTGSYTRNGTCTVCHSAQLGDSSPNNSGAHKSTAVGSSFSCTTGGTGGLGCHNNVSLPTPYATRIWPAGDSWTQCVDCHTGTENTTWHNTINSQHTGTEGTGSGGCTNATGCHGTDLNLIRLHDGAASSNGSDPGCSATSTTGSMGNTTGVDCHSVSLKDARPPVANKSCGGSTGVCHTNYVNGGHGGDHNADVGIGTFGGTAYVLGMNEGCFGCHFTDLRREHGDDVVQSAASTSGAGRTMRMNSGSYPASGNDRCGACHSDQGGTGGTGGDGLFDEGVNAWVQAALGAGKTGGRRCDACHKGDGTTGPRIAHSGGTVPNTPAYTTDFATQFVNWPQGGGHGATSAMTAPYSQSLTTVYRSGTNQKSTGSWTYQGTWPGSLPAYVDAGSTFGPSMMVKCKYCHQWVVGSYPNGPQGANGIITTRNNGSTWTVVTYTNRAQSLCADCHPSASGSHGSHGGTKCVSCHIGIPHAWKRKSLLRRVNYGTINVTVSDGGSGRMVNGSYSFTADVAPYYVSGTTADLQAYTPAAFAAGTWDKAGCEQNGCKSNHAAFNGLTAANVWP